MADLENPWQSPQAGSEPQPVVRGALTDIMLLHLKDASPWLRFIGVLGFIGCGFLALIGVIMLIFFTALSSAWSNLFDSVPDLGGMGSVVGTVFGIFMTVFCLIFAVFLFFPSRFIYSFGTKIKDYLSSSADADLEAAFRNNKSLWKFAGTVMIVYLALLAITIIPAIIGGVAALASMIAR